MVDTPALQTRICIPLYTSHVINTTVVYIRGQREVGLSTLISFLCAPVLERLEIRRFPVPGSNATITRHDNAVMVQQVNLGPFLRENCKKLLYLQLTNVVPVVFEWNVQWPPKP
jgi:hypothetical protein